MYKFKLNFYSCIYWVYSSIMESLSDLNSQIFQDTLKTQIEFIDKKLKTCKIKLLKSGINISGKKENIIDFLNSGQAQNLVHKFFKYKVNNCIF